MSKNRRKLLKGRPLSSNKTDAAACNTDADVAAQTGSAAVAKPPDLVATRKHKKHHTLSVQEKCDLLAELSEAILENPQIAFPGNSGCDTANKRNTPTPPMQQIMALVRHQATPQDQYTSQLALMSLLAVFQDILPSYRIRVPTAKEMAVKVSKETKRQWDYERALLHYYQEFLWLLERTWGKEAKDASPSSLAVTAMIALAELLKKAYHFNFRSNLIKAVVRQMNHRKNEAVRKACCEAVEYVFSNDKQGEVALEIVRQVAKLVKEQGFRVSAPVLRSFLALPLRVHVDEAEAAKLASRANSKKRKRDKEAAEIEDELKEGNASVDKIVLARCQSECLHTITLTYFRVLKNENLKSTHIEELLPPALGGLAKFAHLINIDTVMDLMEVLKELLEKVDTLPVEAALNCIFTAFQTLHGPGKEMKIDLKEYIVPLYSQLPRIATEANSRLHTEVAIKCLSTAFIKHREYATVRIAAFFKEILTTAMHAPPFSSIPLLTFSRILLQRYSSLDQMLENEQDVITSGHYKPDVEDPEDSNAFATAAWELATMKFHVHPGISSQASSAAAAKILQMPREDPEQLHRLLLQHTDELYIPFKRVTKKHPLSRNQSNDSKKRKQLRFITPRPNNERLVRYRSCCC